MILNNLLNSRHFSLSFPSSFQSCEKYIFTKEVKRKTDTSEIAKQGKTAHWEMKPLLVKKYKKEKNPTNAKRKEKQKKIK